MSGGHQGLAARIGVDFDNTLVSYDELMHRLAVERGWIRPEVASSKKRIRDSIRDLPEGELKWQQLQAIAYGAGIAEARLMAGVKTFFTLCRQRQVCLFIVSHKTEYANLDETRTNLRTAAVNWMKHHRFFDADGLGASLEDVYFETTRRDKIERLTRLGCTHFIDDLEETFLEASFPAKVEKILYDPHAQHPAPSGMRVFKTWHEIGDYFFDARH